MRSTFIILILLSFIFGTYYVYNFSQPHSREITHNHDSTAVSIDTYGLNPKVSNINKKSISKVTTDKSIENSPKTSIDNKTKYSEKADKSESKEFTSDDVCEEVRAFKRPQKARNTHRPRFDYRGSSEGELRKRAMLKDGSAQIEYAFRKQKLLFEKLKNNALYNDTPTLSRWRRAFKEVRLFFIRRIEDAHIRRVPLIFLHSFDSPETDYLEVLAWGMINQSMGEKRESLRKFYSRNPRIRRPTSSEVDHAAIIVGQFIELFDLDSLANKGKINFPVEHVTDIDISSASVELQKRIVDVKDCFNSGVSSTENETKKDIIFPSLHNNKGTADDIANSITLRERANQLLNEYLVEIKELDLTERKNREHLLRKSKDIRLNLLLSFKAGDYSSALLLSNFYSLETPEFDALEVLIWKIIANKAGLISNDVLNNLSDSNENILQARSLTEFYIDVYGLFK